MDCIIISQPMNVCQLGLVTLLSVHVCLRCLLERSDTGGSCLMYSLMYKNVRQWNDVYTTVSVPSDIMRSHYHWWCRLVLLKRLNNGNAVHNLCLVICCRTMNFLSSQLYWVGGQSIRPLSSPFCPVGTHNLGQLYKMYLKCRATNYNIMTPKI
jgi:hypothetical protein